MALPPSTTWSKADQVQVELLRRAGITGRFALASSLTDSVIAMSREAIRARDPGLDEVGVLLRWAEVHYGAELAAKLRGHLRR